MKILKKGNLSKCKNYRGIMLLSVPEKVVCHSCERPAGRSQEEEVLQLPDYHSEDHRRLSKSRCQHGLSVTMENDGTLWSSPEIYFHH